MRLLPKSIHRCHRYPTKFNSGRDIPPLHSHRLNLVMTFIIRFKSLALFIAGIVAMAGNRCWAGEPNSPSYLEWNAISELPPSGDQSESLGVAGPFVGVSNDVLIVAGGANFPKPYWGEAEVWHDDIWVLDKSGDWHPGGKLPRPIGYGSSVTTDLGVLCMGGNDASQTYDDVFLLNVSLGDG